MLLHEISVVTEEILSNIFWGLRQFEDHFPVAAAVKRLPADLSEVYSSFLETESPLLIGLKIPDNHSE